ncbi:MAG: hypothetical protein ACR2RA_22065, partial [Geminicoccaceae bacterium]
RDREFQGTGASDAMIQVEAVSQQAQAAAEALQVMLERLQTMEQVAARPKQIKIERRNGEIVGATVNQDAAEPAAETE